MIVRAPFAIPPLVSPAVERAAAPAPARPDLVAFLADDLGVSDTAACGSPDAATPNIARLARKGLAFDQAYVASPSRAPSRAALLTGPMPARNGVEPSHAKPLR